MEKKKVITKDTPVNPTYDTKLSEYKIDYRRCNLIESVKRTEE